VPCSCRGLLLVYGLGWASPRLSFILQISPEPFSAKAKRARCRVQSVHSDKQIQRNWAAELSYATVGKFTTSTTMGRSPGAVYKVAGVGFSAMPTINYQEPLRFRRLGGFFHRQMDYLQPRLCRGFQQSRPPVQRYQSLSGLRGTVFFDAESGVRIEYEKFRRVGSECSVNIPPATCTGRANAKMIIGSAIFKFEGNSEPRFTRFFDPAGRHSLKTRSFQSRSTRLLHRTASRSAGPRALKFPVHLLVASIPSLTPAPRPGSQNRDSRSVCFRQ